MFILLTSFDYNGSPSKKLLDYIHPRGSNQYRMKKKSDVALRGMECFFQAATPDHIFMFSEKKNIDKITLELYAYDNGELKEATYNYPKFIKALEIYEFEFDVNKTPSRNLANDVYAYALRRAYETYSLTTTILISLPPMEKFKEFDRFCEFFHKYIEGEAGFLSNIIYGSWI